MNLQDLRFGIEIETLGITRERAAEAIASVTGGTLGREPGYDASTVHTEDGRVWKAMRDSSITGTGAEIGVAEVVSPVLAYTDIPTLQAIVRALRRAGAKINPSCGIHIHVDASAFTAKSLGNLARLIYKQEPLIEKALGIRHQRLTTYTKPVEARFIAELDAEKPATLESLAQVWYEGPSRGRAHYDHSRYHGLNLHSVWYRGTVEFRWFESTLHAGKVKAYVHFCLALCAKAINSNHASSSRREYREASAKYDFRCFLLRLGMIGDEFKTARHHLLANLPGDTAFRNGRRGHNCP